MAQVERRRPTIMDVARQAGVSKSAVSRALLNQPEVSEQTRLHVLRAARDLGYVANSMAQGLAASRTGRIGVLIRDSSNPIYGFMHTALQRRADEIGMAIIAMTVVSPDARIKEERALESLIALRVDGLLVCSGTLPSAAIEPFLGELPIVALGRPESHRAIHGIAYDEQTCGRELADHVADLGHAAAAVFAVPRSHSISQHVRCQAMAAQLRKRGVRPVLVPAPEGFDAEEFTDRALGDREVTAMMCPNDVTMAETLDLLSRRGVAVPEDMSVTGCDAVSLLASRFLGLTSYELPVETVGRRGIDLMARLMGDPELPVRHERVRGRLVVGRTTAASITAPRRR